MPTGTKVQVHINYVVETLSPIGGGTGVVLSASTCDCRLLRKSKLKEAIKNMRQRRHVRVGAELRSTWARSMHGHATLMQVTMSGPIKYWTQTFSRCVTVNSASSSRTCF